MEMVSRKPWVVPQGMSKGSTAPGESFNSFKTRVLDKLRNILDDWSRNPAKTYFIVTHFHVNRLIEAWLAKYKGRPGTEDDLYDADIYNEDKGAPGDIYWLRKDDTGKLLFTPFDPSKVNAWPAGIFSIRHGSTGWN